MTDTFLTKGDPKSNFSPLAAAEVLGKFIAGHSLKVSQLRGGKRNKIELEKLENLTEIWALCIRKPGSGWRMVGRFLDRDVFAILAVGDKYDIAGDYRSIAEEAVKVWKDNLGSQEPLTGTWISSYLSGTHYDADTATQLYER